MKPKIVLVIVQRNLLVVERPGAFAVERAWKAGEHFACEGVVTLIVARSCDAQVPVIIDCVHTQSHIIAPSPKNEGPEGYLRTSTGRLSTPRGPSRTRAMFQTGAPRCSALIRKRWILRNTRRRYRCRRPGTTGIDLQRDYHPPRPTSIRKTEGGCSSTACPAGAQPRGTPRHRRRTDSLCRLSCSLTALWSCLPRTHEPPFLTCSL